MSVRRSELNIMMIYTEDRSKELEEDSSDSGSDDFDKSVFTPPQIGQYRLRD
jgi:hypothetical protein